MNSGEISEKSIKVLLVEDNTVNQEVAINMLEIQGYDVDLANNGQQALDALVKKNYSLVVMDCEMPVMNGYEATRQWRQLEQEKNLLPVPIIALTAHAISGEREKCLACGMNDFISKPFDFANLRDTLQKWLDSSADRQLDNQLLNDKIQIAEDTVVSSESGVQSEVLNQEKLDQLRHWQGKPNSGLLEKVVHLFLQQMPVLLDDMAQALLQNDAAKVLDIAHTLKSSSGTVGATALMALCMKIESCSRAGEVDADLIEQARQASSIVDSALRIELEKSA